MSDMRVLLLHGLGNHRPRAHWQWWLAEHLRRAHVPVQHPQLPAPDAPTFEAWSEVALAELEMLAGGGERVVLAHSLSCVMWARLAPRLPARLRPSRVALIAPPSRARLASVLPDFPFDEGVNLSAVSPGRVVGRADDPYRDAPLAQVATAWGLPAIEVAGEGHLNHEDGHGPWPSVLAWTLTGDDQAWSATAG
ncbi:RBBP9/YdeN family alpha/beta hydrolase [Demequina capsici]|uniref:Alpha/beta hydrolase n=1 Tax=Demequina capsici TaxID=3075620 RepID=A0AA96JAF6_9MICO|nr:alpha/beta hydrolase [Demequina sp. OYTSA14]WNM24631.1 alpha/beta hydrolase [Demequina sp. OYTSA14]